MLVEEEDVWLAQEIQPILQHFRNYSAGIHKVAVCIVPVTDDFHFLIQARVVVL